MKVHIANIILRQKGLINSRFFGYWNYIILWDNVLVPKIVNPWDSILVPKIVILWDNVLVPKIVFVRRYIFTSLKHII